MKPLILILLLAISAAAQSLPDLARQERERKASLKSSRVLTTDTAKGQAPANTGETKPEPASETAKPAEPPKAAAAPTGEPAKAAPPAPAETKSANDEAAKRYTEELSRLRSKIIALQDQETGIQLQINDLKNSFLAPVTDSDSRTQAQAQIDQAQAQLAAAQQDLAETRRQVQMMEAQGPPKP